MKKLTSIIAAAFMLLVVACEPAPKPIEYGQEACEYCRMSIVDKRYAAQLVSETGKTFSFDAMECMIHFKDENTQHQWHMELVTDYTNPGALIPAAEATVVRSKQLPSPMGMYLTAVGSAEDAKELQTEHNGNLYSYKEVAENMDKLPAL